MKFEGAQGKIDLATSCTKDPNDCRLALKWKPEKEAERRKLRQRQREDKMSGMQ